MKPKPQRGAVADAAIAPSLLANNGMMDEETAAALHKINGLIAMLESNLDRLPPRGPMPEGMHETVWTLRDLAADALRRAGCME